MKGRIRISLYLAAALCVCSVSFAEEFNRIPVRWKWVSVSTAAFSYGDDDSGEDDFLVTVPGFSVVKNVRYPERSEEFPVERDGAENVTFSPDSSKLAYTVGGDLFVFDIASGRERRLTSDGSDLILNGYASWVYYEEIFGRASRYKAFWWSPDSKKIAFYRFDNSEVPIFPIHSPFPQNGTLNSTRYPKAGEKNPSVRIGIVDVSNHKKTVWADFDQDEDQYFGTPFWSPGEKSCLYVPREPRVQQTLDLYRVDPADGKKTPVYHEMVPTWLDWPENICFTDKGLYFARSFEDLWCQVYFLSYDGKELRRLTTGPNWRTRVVRADERTGMVYFTAQRDKIASTGFYRVDRDGIIVPMTDPSLHLSSIDFSPDGSHFIASLSSFTTPTQIWIYETESAPVAWKARRLVSNNAGSSRQVDDRAARRCLKVADMKGDDYDPSVYALPEVITITVGDSLRIPAAVVYPVDFTPEGLYPVHFEIYGGPDNAWVRDRWRTPEEETQWWSDRGIIHVVADSRVAGHCGRRGNDYDFGNLLETAVQDFVSWGRYFQNLPYVIPDKIGVEGFSFGGTMTAMLVMTHSDVFHYGIAGGGVYDWMLYDTHYTERFMNTPQNNPEGYSRGRVLNYVDRYPVDCGSQDGSVMLKLTHGTGDDNVHFQNTLQLVDALQKAGKKFELMIYPDGMHGYRDAQKKHSLSDDRGFWLKYLKGQD